MLHIYKFAQKLKIKKRKRRKSNRIWKYYYFLFFLLPLFSGGWYWWSSALYPCLYCDCPSPPLNCSNGEGDQFYRQCLWSLLLAFVGWSAVKTLWGTCMVEDVVVWLPHSPMLAFDILPSCGGGIGIPPCGCLLAWCAAPHRLGLRRMIPLTQVSFLISFTGTRNPSSNQFCLPSTNKFSPMLERGMSTCTLSYHLH
jgi:hypothetical protein